MRYKEWKSSLNQSSFLPFSSFKYPLLNLIMRSPAFLSAAALLSLLAIPSVQAVNLTSHAQEMFNSSMSFLGKIYDPVAGYLYYFYYPLAAGKHETRSSVWYATGLLQRNEGGAS